MDDQVSEDNSSEKFDINSVYQAFARCSDQVNALDMDHYIMGFKELYRFFMLLGSVFGFVASDIISKVNILEEYRTSENANKYSTVQTMIEHETTSGVIKDIKRPSGSRTLLRLHRALEFVIAFMHSLSVAEHNASSSSIAQKCYKETLSKYHPWLIQKGAMLAMYTLPARHQFIERVSGVSCDEESMRSYEKLMGDIADISKVVYDETQKLYEANNLLNLP